MSKSKSRNDYELPPAHAQREIAVIDGEATLPQSVLARSVLWFCHLRWVITFILAGLGLAGQIPFIFQRLDLHELGAWPFVLAGMLVATNIGYLMHFTCYGKTGKVSCIKKNLWTQILIDLLILTAVVHYVGSIETFISFAYLFHIVLACMFFTRRLSLLVTFGAIALYLTCLILEATGALAGGGLYGQSGDMSRPGLATALGILNITMAIGIWLSVWYLASRLALAVRQRDRQLDLTNRRLIEARTERTRIMLQTTHELKAPFAAIHANAKLLIEGYGGKLDDEARGICQRIANRCDGISTLIQDMLDLANLQKSSSEHNIRGPLQVQQVLNLCIEHVSSTAKSRDISIIQDITPIQTCGSEDLLRMLLSNVLTNAVNYSHDAGEVTVTCRAISKTAGEVIIADDGIGIEPEALSKIFEEHFRSKKAVRHNRSSSGLGLAIVKHIAAQLGIEIKVDSEVGKGTTFKLKIPLLDPVT